MNLLSHNQEISVTASCQRQPALTFKSPTVGDLNAELVSLISYMT